MDMNIVISDWLSPHRQLLWATRFQTFSGWISST